MNACIEIRRDGARVVDEMFISVADALLWMQANLSYSWQHAFTEEGYYLFDTFTGEVVVNKASFVR